MSTAQGTLHQIIGLMKNYDDAFSITDVDRKFNEISRSDESLSSVKAMAMVAVPLLVTVAMPLNEPPTTSAADTPVIT